jgi:CheY-like chemotaxis protein
VGGSAHLLRSERDEREREELLNEIITARDRGAALTRQLLAFARRDVVKPCVIDAGEHVTGLHRLLQRVAGDRVSLHFALAPDCRILVDPSQFEQALVNLVANARDAMPDGGQCQIAIGILRSAGSEDVVEVRVSDTGTGMTSEVVARAFEPFFTTKARGSGTGLGLAAVHAMAVRGEGDARIESIPERGTTVSISLPRVLDPVASAPAPADEAGAVIGGATILVAEDDDGTRRVVYRILRDAGYHVLLASDGLEAWQTISMAGPSIDLLLSDVMMPGLTGPALAERVRATMPGLPVLFMTGYAEDHVRTLSGPRLIGDVVTKPFSGDELIHRIAAMLQRSAASAVTPQVGG